MNKDQEPRQPSTEDEQSSTYAVIAAAAASLGLEVIEVGNQILAVHADEHIAE